MESICNFTIKESFRREQLLSEALEVIRYSGNLMGKGMRSGKLEESGLQSQAIECLQKLGEEQALFSPKLDIYHLTMKDFDERGIEPSRVIKSKMKTHHFYHVNIPITLFPRSGWAFTRLEIWLNFCTDKADVHNCPIVHEIFPDDIWSEILSFQQHLDIGLDENLGFRAEVKKVEGELKQLSNEAQAKLAVKLDSEVPGK